MSNQRKQQYLTNHAVMLYMEELGAKVVAQSGIPGDRYHIGKLIMHSLNEDPDFISQIDAGAKEPDNSETNGSVLARSIRCAIAYKKLGLKVGDVIAVLAPNHIDLAISVYGAQYIGVTIAGMDVTFNANELKHGFVINEPKVVLCQIDKTSDIEEALKLSKTDAVIVTFDKGSKFTCFSDFIGNVSDQEIKDFKPADFDTETTLVMLASTSGSTGLPKSVMYTHKNMALNYPQFMVRFYEFPTPTQLDFMVSPLQWLSAALKYFMSPILKFTRLQTSSPVTRDHIYEIINKYKPTSAVFSPALMTSLLAPGDRDQCDFSCFEVIQVGGSLVTYQLVNTIKEVMPNAEMEIIYGLSELGKALSWDSDVPLGSVGLAMGYSRYRLVDPVTFEDIDEPNVAGELWCKGPTVSPGYYKNPEATRAAYTDDGWLKTGDLFYRDKNNCYYFVERWRTLIKYKSYHVSPSEVEQVIRTHPSVFDVAVVGVPDDECGDLPAAAVVLHKGTSVTAQEIKDLVAESLADSKRLRGGVVFMEEFPLTVTTKLDRQKLKKMVAEMERE